MLLEALEKEEGLVGYEEGPVESSRTTPIRLSDRVYAAILVSFKFSLNCN